MFHVYAIYNVDRGIIYIGQAVDLGKRIARHNQRLPSKSTSYTKRLSGMWILVYDEPVPDSVSARLREKQLKNPRGRAFIWDIIRKNAFR